MYNVHAHVYIAVTLYLVVRFRGWHLLRRVGKNMWQHFEGGGISRCSEISRKYGI